MRIRSCIAAGALLALGVLIGASGCSREPVTSPLRSISSKDSPSGLFPRQSPGSFPNDSVPGDTTPPPPPPPGPPAIVPVAFVGNDSAIAGSTTHIHWALGNESTAPFTMSYTMTCAMPWPGFPVTGTVTIDARSVVPMSVPASIPADADNGTVDFTMTVTRPDTLRPAQATGSVPVASNRPPPPPPPPPIEPVAFAGSDSAVAGGTITLYWRLTNESQVPFTMHWSLESLHGWAGYPVTGSSFLGGGGSTTISTTGAVPDSVAMGPRRARLTVTRPEGRPPASADGMFQVLR